MSSKQSKLNRPTGSAAIVEDLFRDFSSGLEFDPEKLVTATAGVPRTATNSHSSFCVEEVGISPATHESNSKGTRSKSARSEGRSSTDKGSRKRTGSKESSKSKSSKKKKKREKQDKDLERKERNTSKTESVGSSSAKPPQCALETGDAKMEHARDNQGEEKDKSDRRSLTEEISLGQPQKMNIKAVKLSDYLREKGHEVPKAILEAEADDNSDPRSKAEKSSGKGTSENIFGGATDPLSKPENDERKQQKLVQKKSAAGFVPRNVKLKSVQDAKRSPEPDSVDVAVTVTKDPMKKVESVAKKLREALAKKPKIREPSPPVPSRKKLVDISESEDEMPVQLPIPKKEEKSKKKIVFGSLTSAKTIQASHSRSSKRHAHTGEEGEIPSSDDAEASTDGELMDLLGDSDGELKESDNEENRTQHKDKRRKKKKIKKEKKKKRPRSKSPRRRTDVNDRRRSVSPRDRSFWRPRRSPHSNGDRRYRGRKVEQTRGKWAWSRGAMARQKARERSRSPYKRYRKERSPSSEKEDKMLDKKQLFEIARKNASAMLQAGTLQQIRNMSAEEIATLRSGGKSVDELVDYCKKLQRRADRAKKKEDGIETSSESEKSEEGQSFINHPFVVNQAKIVMNIPNATPLPARTPAQRAQEEATLRLTFPVSSGQQHRDKEPEWTPVVPTALAIEGSKEMKALPAPPAPPKLSTPTLALPPPPPPPPPPVPVPTEPSTVGPAGAALEIAAASEIQHAEPVFDDPPSPPPGGIGEIVSKRLEAVKRIQENPNDVEALKLMHCAEEQMKRWAASKNLPGQFTGSTGVQCLTPHELAPVQQAWAKRDQLRNTKAVDSGVGMYLLQKMGWRPGEGLGKTRAGTVEPLSLDIKSDRRGLISLDEMPASKARPNVPFTKDMQGKHPVSALMELCSKRRWGPPSYTCVESGLSNNRRFLWKVVVNGVEYQPATPSGNKKEAKAQASQVVLQSLGLVPRDAKLPMVIG